MLFEGSVFKEALRRWRSADRRPGNSRPACRTGWRRDDGAGCAGEVLDQRPHLFARAGRMSAGGCVLGAPSERSGARGPSPKSWTRHRREPPPLSSVPPRHLCRVCRGSLPNRRLCRSVLASQSSLNDCEYLGFEVRVGHRIELRTHGRDRTRAEQHTMWHQNQGVRSFSRHARA